MSATFVPCAVPHTFLAKCPICKRLEPHTVRCRLACECRPCWYFEVRALMAIYYDPIAKLLRQKHAALEIVIRSDEPRERCSKARRALKRLMCGAVAKHDFNGALKPIVRFMITCPRDATEHVLGHFRPHEIVSYTQLRRAADVALALERIIPFWGKERTAQLRGLYPDVIPLPHKLWGGLCKPAESAKEESRTRRPRSFAAFGALAGLGGISKGRKMVTLKGETLEAFKTCTGCAINSPLQAHEIRAINQQW